MKINNVEAYAKDMKYVVFRIVDGTAWYYNAWNDYGKALAQAIDCGGYIIPSSEVEKGDY